MDQKQLRQDFLQKGYCYFSGIIPDSELPRIRESVRRDVWANNHLERPTGYVPGFLRFNQDLAPYMAAEPIVRFVESVFGPHFRISFVTGTVNGPGIPRGSLHSDWPFNQKSAAHIPAPYPNYTIHMVTMWMLSDFTVEGGGTIIVPGSHLKECHPIQGGPVDPDVPYPGEERLIGRAGTVAAFDARMWHAVAPNVSDDERVGILVRYAPWWLNLDTLRPGTIDHEDIVAAAGAKDSIVPALAREVFDRLPDNVKPLLHYAVAAS